MDPKWTVIRDGKTFGPYDELQLKRLVVEGSLLPKHLLLAEGADTSSLAASVPGLFSSAAPMFSANLSGGGAACDKVPPWQTSPVALLEQVSRLFASVSQNAKRATQLAALTAERARLTTMTLPAAYETLGSHYYSLGVHREQQVALYAQLDELQAMAKQSGDPAEQAALPATLAETAKALAAQGVELASAQKRKLVQRRVLAELGQRIYEATGGNSDEDTAKAIEERVSILRTQKEQLDCSIRAVSHLIGVDKPFRSERVKKFLPAVVGLVGVVLCLWVATRGWQHSPASPQPTVDTGRSTRRGTSDGTSTQSAQPPVTYKADTRPLDEAIAALAAVDRKSPQVYFAWRDRTGEVDVGSAKAPWIWRGGEIEQESGDWRTTQRTTGPVKAWVASSSDTVKTLRAWLSPYFASRGDIMVPISIDWMSIDGRECLVLMGSEYKQQEAEKALAADKTPTLSDNQFERAIDEKRRAERAELARLTDSDAVRAVISKDLMVAKGKAEPKVSGQRISAAADFNAEEIQVIRGNERLGVVFELGHLDKTKLARYSKYVASLEQSGRPPSRSRGGENAMLLQMIPPREWPSAGKRLGMSVKEYRGATNFIMSMIEKYNGADNAEYEKYLQRYTGQTLSAY